MADGRIERAAGQPWVGGDLVVPRRCTGLVVFAHGSGSSRASPRNQAVATLLQSAGLATLLLDLLTVEEERRDAVTAEHRFDIELLAERVLAAIEQSCRDMQTAGLPLGLFGASTGAAAALVAAAGRPDDVLAVVSRGGRPDLAGPMLSRVRAATLLVVGEADTAVLELNREALSQLREAQAHLEIVPGASHLFEEPGALSEVARLARDWFVRWLVDSRP